MMFTFVKEKKGCKTVLLVLQKKVTHDTTKNVL